MTPGKKLLITAAVAIAAGALLFAVWSNSLPRESPAQRRARELVAELRREPPGRFQAWLIRLGLKQRPDPRQPREIVAEFVSLGEDAVPALIEAFEDEKPWVSSYAAEAVIGIGPSAVPHLIRALKDERASVRFGAVVVLGEFGPAARQAIPALEKIVRTEQDSRVCRAAEMSLKKVRSGPLSSSDSVFVGTRRSAPDLVYVVDKSGSMVDRLPWVKIEVATSIGQLTEFQDFHIVLYGISAEGGPAEGLIPATEENKLKAARFLRGIRAQGQADPVPALERAFEVLSRADTTNRRKLIYLFTDGVFPDNEKVLEVIRMLNKHKEVWVNTYLLGERHPVAVSVLKRIASETGGSVPTTPRLRWVLPPGI